MEAGFEKASLAFIAPDWDFPSAYCCAVSGMDRAQLFREDLPCLECVDGKAELAYARFYCGMHFICACNRRSRAYACASLPLNLPPNSTFRIRGLPAFALHRRRHIAEPVLYHVGL